MYVIRESKHKSNIKLKQLLIDIYLDIILNLIVRYISDDLPELTY